MTLIEVMIALFMLASLLTSLFITQDSVFIRVNYYSSAYNCILLLKEKLTQTMLKLNLESSKKDLDGGEKILPELAISYEKKIPNKKSSLNQFKSIIIEKAIGKWTDINGKHQESLVCLRYNPEKEQ